jgi:hypothetical protein
LECGWVVVGEVQGWDSVVVAVWGIRGGAGCEFKEWMGMKGLPQLSRLRG